MNRRDFLARAGVAALGAGVGPVGVGVGRGRTDRDAVRERDWQAALRDHDPQATAREYGQQDTYRNPVYDQIFPDPDVLRVGGTYYAYATYHPWTEGEGPDRELVSVLRSPDLVRWQSVGPAFEAEPDWSQYRGLWAPGVGRFGDRTVLYYSDSEFGADNPGVGVATASDPAGPFEPRGGLFRSEAVGVPNSIDPAVFVRDGSPYLVWGSHRGIYGIELAEDGLSTAAGADGSAVNPDEKFQIAGRGVEAPYLIERGDYVYVFGSRGTCCDGAESTYHVVVGRAEDVRGPYRNREGESLTAEGATGTTILRGNDEFLAPGHCAAVQDAAGEWWLLYHAYEAGNAWVGDTPRRVLMLDHVQWEDGWPRIGDDGTPSERGRLPAVEAATRNLR